MDLIDVITPASQETGDTPTGDTSSPGTTQPLKDSHLVVGRARGATRKRRGNGSNADIMNDNSSNLPPVRRRVQTKRPSTRHRRKSRMHRTNLTPKLFDYFTVVGVKQVNFEKPKEPISHNINPSGMGIL